MAVENEFNDIQVLIFMARHMLNRYLILMIRHSCHFQSRRVPVAVLTGLLWVVLMAGLTPGYAGNKTDTAVYRALLIGNSHYASEKWPDLLTSVQDVRSMAKVLQHSYGFAAKNVVVLENADRQSILKGLYQLAAVSEPEDSVLVYYAGHGESGRGSLSWWVPVGADHNYDYISAQEVQLRLQIIVARHKLLIVDSCFSGGFLSPQDPPRIAEFQEKESGAAPRSVQVITSGGDEPVSDGGPVWGGHSIFAYHLLAQLKAYTGRGFSATSLGKALTAYVSKDTGQMGRRQTPSLVSLRHLGHEGGDFTFVKSNAGSSENRREVLLVFLDNRGSDFHNHGGAARKLLFNELQLIFQRNGFRVVNQLLDIPDSDVESQLRSAIRSYPVSQAMLVKLDLTIGKQQTRIWKAMAIAEATVQAFYFRDGNTIRGDSFKLNPQKLPIDHWEETATYRRVQYENTMVKLIGSYRETAFAAFLRNAFQ
ncbi:caspase family protein [bacterium]|nr:caspase family protein [bacterium]